MAEIYALLVGVDAYPPEISGRPLHGCVNDVRAARAWLVACGAHIAVLHDAAATRAAIVAGIRSHLGQAGEVPLCLSSSEVWGSGLVEGAVAEHGEQHADAVAGEAEEGAEGELNRVPFHLDRWRPDDASVARAGAAGHGDGVLRLTSPAPPDGRDAGPAAGPGHGGPGWWAAVTPPLRTIVPVSGRDG
jgi:hypothetical protein